MNQQKATLLKQKLHQACEDSLEKRLRDIKTALKEAQDAANQETKSSAGDKHETGRAMMQLETEKLSRQMHEVLNEQQSLQMIRTDQPKQSVDRGALVVTNHLKLYIAISAGRLLLEGEEYFAISIDTPLGLALKGKKAGETGGFQNKTHEILQIF
ncbi:transcription elongation GreA/GreB family factor [Catalinimonas alkaloidigena]|uniref:3-oxoacyl-ACP synthase n=1 Tax=Catalinimonas alkaloidigena TaxID=1075417 RepID=UPI002406604B|nr:3-oxoacyl-ACP synthase [Catalinimonas alkaloidigena]MDF9796588.1 transcription elongation GreA/GreB family factor [Catalinimonas alkaloidigena]